jgi:hypothetical protein
MILSCWLWTRLDWITGKPWKISIEETWQNKLVKHKYSIAIYIPLKGRQLERKQTSLIAS